METGWMIVAGLALAARVLSRLPSDDTRAYSAMRERLRPSPEQTREYERRWRRARAVLRHERMRRETRGG